MNLARASTAVLLAFGFTASIGASAYACEWMKTTAKVSTPATDEQLHSSATPVDPVMLAKTESLGEAEVPEEK